MRTRLLLGLAIAAALVFSAGCQNLVTGTIEKATGVSVSEKDGQVTVRGKDGETVTIGGGELAPELRELPLPTGFTAQRDGAGSISSKEGRLLAGTWRGSQTIQQVLDFYKREMPGRGYTEDFATQSTDGALIQFSQQTNRRSVVITVTREGNQTELAVRMAIGN